MSDSEESEEELHDIDWSQSDPFFDYEDPFALSPQISAVNENNVKRLQHLIQSGKSVNINDNNGNTPLHIAVLKDKGKAFDYLLTVDEVRIDAENFDGTTPLLLALICFNEPFALKLIEKGADVNLAKHTGYAPLHYAVANSMNVGRTLIEKGADINVRNDLGETPLFIACERGNCDIIHMLLYYGADVDIPNCEGILPFDLVLSKCPQTLQQIFFDYNFDQEKIPVNLYTLTEAMKARSFLFPKLIEKAGEVFYDEADLQHLNNSLPYIDINVFQIFLDKFEEIASDMFSLCSSLTDYITFLGTHINQKGNFIDFMYALCDSPLVSTVMENYQPKMYLVYSLINQHISDNALTKLVCCLLSYGVDIQSHDLNTVYKHYGFCELFKIMLHMDIIDCSGFRNDTINWTFIMPNLIYNMTFDVDRCLEDPGNVSLNSIQKLMKFFALPKLKEYCLKSFTHDTRVIDKVKNVITMPSLVELSRNAARKYIIHKYNVKKSVHFFTILKWLPISDVYKAILSYEKELYRV